MTGREALGFRTFGFLQCRQMLSSREMGALSTAFDAAMERAGRHRPTPSGERQQVVPFFDYDPDAFYPLLEDERLVEVFETLLGEDFILTATEGIIHAGGTPWHRDACAPEGMFSMRAAIYLDPARPGRRLSQRHSRQPFHSVPRGAGDVRRSVGTASRGAAGDGIRS